LVNFGPESSPYPKPLTNQQPYKRAPEMMRRLPRDASTGDGCIGGNIEAPPVAGWQRFATAAAGSPRRHAGAHRGMAGAKRSTDPNQRNNDHGTL